MRFLSPARPRSRRPTPRRLSPWLVVTMLKAPGDMAVLRYKERAACRRAQRGASVKERGACQRAQRGASVGRGSESRGGWSQVGLAPFAH